ncbi:MAG: FMN-binding protein [Bacteroidales bacterium]
MKTLIHIVNLLLISAMLLGVAISRDSKAFGKNLKEQNKSEFPSERCLKELGLTPTTSLRQLTPSIWRTSDGSEIYSTEITGKEIFGFGGSTPLYILVNNGIIQKVTYKDNDESPSFWNNAQKLLTTWNGLTIKQASEKKVDAVSGATISSNSILDNFQSILPTINNQIKKKR